MGAESHAAAAAASVWRRFELRRRLGEGAFGVVWEAFDRERNTRVALKSLVHTDASALYLFKHEFRALADIVHPNLVTLYELWSTDEEWFFTMEYVDGVDFLRYTQNPMLLQPTIIRPTSRRKGMPKISRSGGGEPKAGLKQPTANDSAEWFNDPTLLHAHESDSDDDGAEEDSDPTLQVRLSPIPMPSQDLPLFDTDRLRAALRQLTAGLLTLHAAGKLHRDIKPSNVLVTREGRVVILDFGLIAELTDKGAAESKQPIVGTPVFMSPEQGLGQPLSPASDWYSVGVMLYAALTGRVPFDGPPMHVLLNKTEVDPISPAAMAPGVPADLEALCMKLLARDPQARPTGRDILRQLGAETERGPILSVVPSSGTRSSIFVGRAAQLDLMNQAFGAARRGQSAAILIFGESGMGKSALIQRFLNSAKATHPEAVILHGRCYQRESVPYKAVDSLIDALSMHLQDLSPDEVTELLPRGLEELARIFPVLRQVPLPYRPHPASPRIIDPHELRSRAFTSLRRLLTKLAQRNPLIIAIDDMQWSDADSDALLTEIVHPPNAPPCLLIASYRAENVHATALSDALEAPSSNPCVLHTLHLKEFSPEEAERLAMSLLGSRARDRAEAIAREAGGNPLFIDALVRYAQSDGDEEPLSGKTAPPYSRAKPQVRLEEMIQAQVNRLNSGARRLLEILAVAGHPLDAAVARRIAGTETYEPAVLSLLLVSNLVKQRADTNDEEIVIYHDRIRESVLRTLKPEEIKANHDRIATVLELSQRADPELLFVHFMAAGRTTKALHYVLQAADDAFDALGFDRAARLYRLALSLEPPQKAPILARLGDSLTNAGRGAEAAEAYVATAEISPPAEALEMRRRAAEQWLISGHVDQGLEAVRRVLSPLGMKIPETPNRALLSLLKHRLQLWFRGLKFKKRLEKEIPPAELLRIDICWAVAVGLSLVDSVRGTDFQARHLLLALRAGEPYRIARALAVELPYAAASSLELRPRTKKLMQLSESLAQEIQKPHAIALSTAMAGAAHYMSGHWKEGLTLLDQGATMFREQCTGVTWELDTVDIFAICCLFRMGRLGEMTERLHWVFRNAQARGDLYVLVHNRLAVGWPTDTALDQIAEGRRTINEALALSTHQGGDLMNYCNYVCGIANFDLYENRPLEAWERLSKAWSDFKRAYVFQIPMARIDVYELRARCAILCAAEDNTDIKKRETFLRSAERDVKRIEKERAEWSNALAFLLRAGIQSVRGRMDEARRYAEACRESASKSDLRMHEALALRRLGEMLGDDTGRAKVAEADKAIAALGVKSPSKLANLLAPGKFSTVPLLSAAPMNSGAKTKSQ